MVAIEIALAGYNAGVNNYGESDDRIREIVMELVQ